MSFFKNLFGQRTLPPPPLPLGVNENLRMTYERACRDEQHVRGEISSLSVRSAAALAFAGVIFVGVFTAIPSIAWGFAQLYSIDHVVLIVLPNVLVFAYVVNRGRKAWEALREVLKNSVIEYPWGNEIAQPETLRDQSPDNVAISLIYQVSGAQAKNRKELTALGGLMDSAFRFLANIAIVLVLQAGYNAAMQAAITADATHQHVLKHHYEAAKGGATWFLNSSRSFLIQKFQDLRSIAPGAASAPSPSVTPSSPTTSADSHTKKK